MHLHFTTSPQGHSTTCIKLLFRRLKIQNTTSSWPLDHILWDRNPGFLKSEIGPFSDFKTKSHLMDLKSAHSQESDLKSHLMDLKSHLMDLKSGGGRHILENGKRDRALLKTVFVLHGQAFGYAQGICGFRYFLQWRKPMTGSHADS